MQSLKIVSWNVNSVNSRLERLQKFLIRENPDIVCLQELKCEAVKYPFGALEALGYRSAVHGQKTYNGVAILSKEPLELVEQGFSDGAEDPQARFIFGVYKGVAIASCYIPNGQAVGTPQYQYKLDWLTRLNRFVSGKQQKHSQMVLCGDFNIAPSDLDVHDPLLWKDKILCSDLERAAFQSLMRLGFHDTFRSKHSQEKLFSWWDYRMLGFVKNHGLRIDFVLASPTLVEKCVEARIDREERKGDKPSDHAPCIAVFEHESI